MECGYVRASTKEQNKDWQMATMWQFSVMDSHIILGKQSGKKCGICRFRKSLNE